MGDIERFLLDNLQVILLLAFILLPLLFNRKARKQMKPPPTQGEALPRERSLGETVEDKVRRFFEDLAQEESSSRPTAGPAPQPPPPSPAPFRVPLSREDIAEGEVIESSDPSSFSMRKIREPAPAASAYLEEKVEKASEKLEKKLVAPLMESKQTIASVEQAKAVLIPANPWKEKVFGTRSSGVQPFRRASLSRLREAVIWKEILDKPIGLRPF